MSEFTHEVAKPGNLPLAISIAGYAKSGKTLSALRLAAGIQQAKGGDIWQIDTENRGNEYGSRLRYQHVPLRPPFTAARYQAAAKYAHDNGARIIVIDSMSHEHDGTGGLLEQHERFLFDKCNGREPTDSERYKHGQAGWARVKGPRKRMENYFRDLRDAEDPVVFVFCFRANLKYVPKTKDDKLRMASGEVKQEETDKQWEVTSTSELPYDCAASLLLIPGEAGTIIVKPTTEAEKALILSTDTFKPYLQTVKQLDESVGRKLYELAKGTGAKSAAARGGRVLFHRDYGEATGEVAASDPPTVSDYIHWLELRESSAALIDHLAKVRDIQNSMLQREAS